MKKASQTKPSQERPAKPRGEIFPARRPASGELRPCKDRCAVENHPRHRIHEQPLNVLSALGAFGAGWTDDLLVGMSWQSLRGLLGASSTFWETFLLIFKGFGRSGELFGRSFGLLGRFRRFVSVFWNVLASRGVFLTHFAPLWGALAQFWCSFHGHFGPPPAAFWSRLGAS